MRLSDEKMGEQGLRGLGALPPIVEANLNAAAQRAGYANWQAANAAGVFTASTSGFGGGVIGAVTGALTNVVKTAQATVQAAGDAIAHPTITNLTKAIGLQTGMQFTAGAPGVETTEKIGKVIDAAAVIGTAATFAAPALTGSGTSIPGSSLLAPIKSTLTAAQLYQKLEQQKKEDEAKKQAEADAADLAARKKILADLQAKQAAQPKNILSNPLAWLALAGSFLL